MQLLKTLKAAGKCSQDQFWGGAGAPKMWTFWMQKVDFFELHPLKPPTKTSFLAHFVTKSGPFGKFGVVHRTLLATGLGRQIPQKVALMLTVKCLGFKL